MTTIRDIAQVAGVSLATASRVLGSPAGRFPVKRETEERVRAAADRLGYHLNYHMQAVATGRANAIGFCAEVVLLPTIGLGSGGLYFDSLRGGVEYITQEAGNALMNVHPGKGMTSLERGIAFMKERRLDALVVPGSVYVMDLKDKIEASPELPVVVVNPTGAIRRPRVMFDVDQAMKMTVDHLVGLGHRQILWLGPEPRQQGMESIREQLLIRNAWEASVTGETCRVPIADLGMAITYDKLIERVNATLLERLAQTPRQWTAIAAYNECYAIAAISALTQSGLHVPTDVSVIGFDNLISSFCLPAITTIDHCFFEMGQRAGRLAAELVDADVPRRREMIDHVETVTPKLIVRQSTGPARH